MACCVGALGLAHAVFDRLKLSLLRAVLEIIFGADASDDALASCFGFARTDNYRLDVRSCYGLLLQREATLLERRKRRVSVIDKIFPRTLDDYLSLEKKMDGYPRLHLRLGSGSIVNHSIESRDPTQIL